MAKAVTVKPSVKLEKITPAGAAKLLERRYVGQRRISTKSVEKLAGDIRNGMFNLTGDTIKIDVNGDLIDGQHRLTAIVKAGVPVELFVARDVQAEAFMNLDQGRKRTFSDYLRSRGVPYEAVVAAGVAKIGQFIRSEGRLDQDNGGVDTIAQMTAVLKAEHGIVDWAAAAHKIGHVFRFSAGTWCALLYLADQSKAADVDFFVERLLSGKSLAEGDPILLLRNAMLHRLSLRADRRMSQAHYTNVIVRAWNAYARGETITFLKGSVRGKAPVMFDPEGLLAARWSTQLVEQVER